MPGFFISFEGIDGTGKSTQIKLLAEALKAEGHDLYVTKEPGDTNAGSNVGPGIRSMLFGTPGTKNVAPGVADLLFLADHVQNSYDIQEALKADKVVLTDRYADSQFAYAASETKRAPDWTNRLFEQHYGPTPNLTFLFIVKGPVVKERVGPSFFTKEVEDISWALARANARRGVEAGKQDGKAWNDVSEQRLIQEEYISLLSAASRTVLVYITETSTVENIHETLLSLTKGRMVTTVRSVAA